LKITLDSPQGTVYEPAFLGQDAGLVDPGYRRDGSSVFYIKLGSVEEEGILDIVLRLIAPPARKPPDDMRLPIMRVGSSQSDEEMVATITPSEESLCLCSARHQPIVTVW
jgi:hypothetical protein